MLALSPVLGLRKMLLPRYTINMRFIKWRMMVILEMFTEENVKGGNRDTPEVEDSLHDDLRRRVLTRGLCAPKSASKASLVRRWLRQLAIIKQCASLHYLTNISNNVAYIGFQGGLW